MSCSTKSLGVKPAHDGLVEIVYQCSKQKKAKPKSPELRSKDPEERLSAIFEKQRLSDLLTNARVIELRNIDRDKYFRIGADVYIDGEPLLPKLNQQYLTGGK